MCVGQLPTSQEMTGTTQERADVMTSTSPKVYINSDSFGIGETFVLTFVPTAVFMLVAGVVIGSTVTLCVIKKGTSQYSEQDLQMERSAIAAASDGQFYEEVIQVKQTTEKFEMGENVAYGPVT